MVPGVEAGPGIVVGGFGSTDGEYGVYFGAHAGALGHQLSSGVGFAFPDSWNTAIGSALLFGACPIAGI